MALATIHGVDEGTTDRTQFRSRWIAVVRHDLNIIEHEPDDFSPERDRIVVAVEDSP